MSYLEEDWQPIAATLGYVDEKAMLEDLYVIQDRSISNIAKIIGCAPFTVRTRLLRVGIELRGRGGPHNRKGRRKLSHLTDHELYHTEVMSLVKQFGVHPCTVSAERRLRKMMKEQKVGVEVPV